MEKHRAKTCQTSLPRGNPRWNTFGHMGGSAFPLPSVPKMRLQCVMLFGRLWPSRESAATIR